MSVEVAMPVTDSITIYKTYPGYISANTSAAVVGRVNGTLLTRTYDSGSLVKKRTSAIHNRTYEIPRCRAAGISRTANGKERI